MGVGPGGWVKQKKKQSWQGHCMAASPRGIIQVNTLLSLAGSSQKKPIELKCYCRVAAGSDMIPTGNKTLGHWAYMVATV